MVGRSIGLSDRPGKGCRELLRRIPQHRLDAGNPSEVSREIAETAPLKMLFSGSVLNAQLLGRARPQAARDRADR